MTDILKRQNITTFLAHLLCISILFILPEVISNLSNPGRPIKLWVYMKTVVFIGDFYVTYYWIIEKSLDQPKRLLRFTAYNACTIIISLLLCFLIWRYKGYFGGKVPLNEYDHPTVVMYLTKALGMLSRDLVMIILVIGFATALRLGDKWIKLDRRRQDLLSSQREEELKNLKSQLNPHFLFNTLNSIYALIAISPTKAQEAVHELSRLLRYVLYDTSATVSLKQELGFIDNYINLMKLRLNPSVKLNVSFDTEGDENIRVAPLIFITPIENVFKHGIHTHDIPIEISVTAKDGRICCTTSNGRIPTSDNERQNSQGGIGLANLRRRLDLIYGKNARLDIKTTPDTYRVTLTIDTTAGSANPE